MGYAKLWYIRCATCRSHTCMANDASVNFLVCRTRSTGWLLMKEGNELHGEYQGLNTFECTGYHLLDEYAM